MEIHRPKKKISPEILHFILKLSWEEKRKKSSRLRLRCRVLRHDTEIKIPNEKNNKLEFIRIKTLCSTKCGVKENEKTSHKLRENYLQITYLTKDSYLDYIKNSQNLKFEQKQSAIKIFIKDMNIFQSINTWQIGKWKYTQHD